MKVLVTGAAGFIGYSLSDRLCRRGDEVVGLDNLTPYYDVNLKKARLEQLRKYPNFRLLERDISVRSGLEAAFAEVKPTRVVHLAAQAGVRYSLTHPHAYLDSNLQGFLNILECVRHQGTEHLVYASSSSVYGANRAMPFSESQNCDHALSLYAATKKANELMAHCYSHLYRIPTTGLRFFTVYGPWGRPDMALFLFTKNILEGKPIDVFNFGNHRRDFTFINDIVEGVTRILDQAPAPDPSWNALAPDPATSNAPYRVYNIGNHNPVPLEEMIAELEAALGKKALRNPLPMQPGDVPETFADVSALKRDFQFEPKTSIRDGIHAFVSWYKSFYGVG